MENIGYVKRFIVNWIFIGKIFKIRIMLYFFLYKKYILLKDGMLVLCLCLVCEIFLLKYLSLFNCIKILILLFCVVILVKFFF